MGVLHYPWSEENNNLLVPNIKPNNNDHNNLTKEEEEKGKKMNEIIMELKKKEEEKELEKQKDEKYLQSEIIQCIKFKNYAKCIQLITNNNSSYNYNYLSMNVIYNLLTSLPGQYYNHIYLLLLYYSSKSSSITSNSTNDKIDIYYHLSTVLSDVHNNNR